MIKPLPSLWSFRYCIWPSHARIGIKFRGKRLSNYKVQGARHIDKKRILLFKRQSLDVTKWGSPAATDTCLVTVPVLAVDRNTARSTDVEIGDEIFVHSYVFKVPLFLSQLLCFQGNSFY